MKLTRWLLIVLLVVCSSLLYISSHANSKNLNLSNNSLPLTQSSITKQNSNEGDAFLRTVLKGTTFNTRKFDLPNALAPISLKSGDLDRDGDLDLVTINQDSNSITILSNNGNGDFLTKDIILSEIGGLAALTIGDFDGDKDLDIITTNSLSSNITLLTNDGTGNFAQENLFLSGVASPISILSADLDKDGDLDLVTVNPGNNTVAIISNNGKARFTDNSMRLITVYDATSLTIGDLDSDGDLDLVTANRDSKSITILTNNGHAKFKDSFISLEKSPLSITTGDLDKDGYLDLITSNQDNTISILTNQVNGKFTSREVTLPEGASSPISITTGDLDRDGDLDLITANSASNNVTILVNNGVDGFSGVNVTKSQELSPFSLVAADLNADGYLDLATVNKGSNNLSLFLNIHPNNATTQTLPFTQDWSNTGLITTDDDWSNVPGIIGYRGDDITAATAADPQTLLGEGTITVDVIANQTNPNGLATGGVAEFQITNPSVALQGSGTADAPNIIINLNTTGFNNINVAYNLRDLDGSTDNAVQAVALQYRVGTTGNFTNVSAGFVADATSGPSLATLVTAVSATLPAAANNQSTVQVRVITSNATGNDEWVGVDDINITGTAIAQPGSLQFSSAIYSVAENVGSATITVTRTGGSNGSVTVDYATSDGIATAGSDYTTSSGTLTFADSVTSQTFSVPVLDDFIAEGNETVNLTLSNPTGGATLGTPSTALLIITNVPKPGSLQFSSATYSVAENGTSATITVTRTNGSEGSVTINYATSNGTATAGSDYTSSSGTLTFANGVTSQTFSVPILDDLTDEADETVNLALSNPTGGATLGTPSSAVLTITDNDPPASLSINDISLTEGNSGTSVAAFTVSLTPASGLTVMVNFATADGTATVAGSDYVATNGTLTFAPGVTSQTVSVNINGDNVVETNETFFVNLSTPVNATISDSQGIGTITNDDVANSGTLQFSAATYSVAENVGSATITVTRTGGSNGSVTVNYATSNGTATAGSDYTTSSGTLTFADSVTSQTFSVPVLDDFIAEGNETVNLTLSNPTGGATLGTPSTALLTITNVPKPGSLQFSSATYSVAENGTSATITVTRTNGSEGSVTVNYATSNGTATAGSDYTTSSGTLTFANGVTSQTFSVTVMDDVVAEGDETVNLTLSNPTGGATLGTPNASLLIITNVAKPGSLQFSAATYSVAENGTSATITVTRTNGSEGSVTINYATSNGTAIAGSDYTTSSGTLTFANGVTSQTFSIPLSDDLIDENDETVNLTLSSPTGGATLGTPNTAVLTITDNDPPASLSINDISLSEGNSGTSVATFTVNLTPASGLTVMVSFATANGTATAGSDYIAASGTLTFAPGVTSQTVSVNINGDVATELNETFNVNLSNPINAVIVDSQGVGTIINDDFIDHLTIYAADANNNRIQRSFNDGASWSVVGLGAGVGLGQFKTPRGVTANVADTIIFVADTGNNRIQRSTNGGASWTVIATAGVAVGTVNAPQGIAYDETRDILYIADTANNRIQMVTSASSATPIFTIFANATAGATVGKVNQPRGITVDANGNVYVADTLNNRIQVNVGGVWNIFADATAGAIVGKMNAPRGIHVNALGQVFVADTANNRIQTFTGGVWSVFMTAGVAAGSVVAPEGVTVTATANAIISDTGNNRVQRKLVTGSTATVIGSPGLAVNQFNQPAGIR